MKGIFHFSASFLVADGSRRLEHLARTCGGSLAQLYTYLLEFLPTLEPNWTRDDRGNITLVGFSQAFRTVKWRRARTPPLCDQDDASEDHDWVIIEPILGEEGLRPSSPADPYIISELEEGVQPSSPTAQYMMSELEERFEYRSHISDVTDQENDVRQDDPGDDDDRDGWNIYPKMHTQMDADLEVLRTAFGDSNWLARNLPEPRIGDEDCHELAVKYGARSLSCFVVFVHYWGNGAYGCRHEACFRGGEEGTVYHSLEEAIRHQRYHHFYHQPFECIPASGTLW